MQWFTSIRCFVCCLTLKIHKNIVFTCTILSDMNSNNIPFQATSKKRTITFSNCYRGMFKMIHYEHRSGIMLNNKEKYKQNECVTIYSQWCGLYGYAILNRSISMGSHAMHLRRDDISLFLILYPSVFSKGEITHLYAAIDRALSTSASIGAADLWNTNNNIRQ